VTVPGQVLELLPTVTTDSKVDTDLVALIRSAPEAKAGRGVSYRMLLTTEEATRLNTLARQLRTANQAGDRIKPVDWACARLISRTPKEA
jgi:hypothetical protein